MTYLTNCVLSGCLTGWGLLLLWWSSFFSSFSNSFLRSRLIDTTLQLFTANFQQIYCWTQTENKTLNNNSNHINWNINHCKTLGNSKLSSASNDWVRPNKRCLHFIFISKRAGCHIKICTNGKTWDLLQFDNIWNAACSGFCCHIVISYFKLK